VDGPLTVSTFIRAEFRKPGEMKPTPAAADTMLVLPFPPPTPHSSAFVYVADSAVA
jgi:hypothetical protein